VECYWGRKADERPVRSGLKPTCITSRSVLDQRYDPEPIFFIKFETTTQSFTS
jgi:hypothetical protein